MKDIIIDISMQQVHGKIGGPVAVEEDTALHGMITVSATVRSGVVLEMHGMITGDLTVEKGGQAIIHGMVNGTVWNYGHVTIYGTVDSIANWAPECQMVIDPQAYIKGRQT